MKLIINISKADWERYKKTRSEFGARESVAIQSIVNGTPLDSVRAEINGLSGFYSQVTGISEMNTVRSVISDVNNIIDNIGKAEKSGEGADEITVLDTLNHTIENVRIKG